MKMEAKDYLKRPYARRLTPDVSGGFVATIQEFPGCIAEGDTSDIALTRLEAAAESWIEASLEQGRDIPEPIDMQGFSGKIALRIPRGLHKQAAEMALSEGTSINQLLTAAIANYFGGKQTLRHVTAYFTQNNLTLNVHIGVQKQASTLGQDEARLKLPSFVRPQAIAETRDHG
jgi:antitoxin HicB